MRYHEVICRWNAQGRRRICLVSRTGHAPTPIGSPLSAALASAAMVTIARCDAAVQDDVACLMDAFRGSGRQLPVQVSASKLLLILPQLVQTTTTAPTTLSLHGQTPILPVSVVKAVNGHDACFGYIA